MPGIHVFDAGKTWMAGTIGERSDAVLRTAMASPRVLPSASPRVNSATPFFERLCPAMTAQCIWKKL
jgi:hypothetical protein